MNSRWLVAAAWCVLGALACSSTDEAEPTVVSNDTANGSGDAQLPDVDEPEDIVLDTEGGDDATAPADSSLAEDVAVEPDGTDAGPVASERAWTYRAIGGISMGAAAMRLGLENVEMFDAVGGLGGYVSFRYMATSGARLQLGGFCPLETIEGNLDTINEIDTPGFCGAVDGMFELEFAQDFNHLYYDDNGASWSRGFYANVLRTLSTLFGNLTAESAPESPYLPYGVNYEWFSSTTGEARCGAPTDVPIYNAEYNPDGTYSTIVICDSDKRELPGLDGADFDPTVEHTKPVDVLLAVDINGNGKRDYAEPVVVNIRERFDDVGVDGCTDAFEDGQGGCNAEASPATVYDPNGDNFHWSSNPTGTELNDWHDEGEPFQDKGLDGVSGTSDFGEDNGEYDISSGLANAEAADAGTLIAGLTDAQLANVDLYFDSGIRDTLHAAVSSRLAVSKLIARGEELAHYGDIAGRPESLFPEHDYSSVTVAMLPETMTEDAVGKHVYAEYGDPNATPEMLADGDGKHVGTIDQALARIVAFYAFALSRMPEPDLEAGIGAATVSSHTFYSPSLGARQGYVLVLPPGYDDHPDRYYPSIYMLHGLGMKPEDMQAASFFVNVLMQQGAMPKAIQVFPDGRSCRVYKDDHSKRECACGDNKDGVRECVDPTCTGPEESCETRDVDDALITEECVRANFYAKNLTNKWGEARDDMEYGAALLELIDHIDANYRTRSSISGD